MPKKTFYAVAVGRNPGIYRTWEECQAQIHGFSRQKYLACATQEEAEGFLANNCGNSFLYPGTKTTMEPQSSLIATSHPALYTPHPAPSTSVNPYTPSPMSCYPHLASSSFYSTTTNPLTPPLFQSSSHPADSPLLPPRSFYNLSPLSLDRPATSFQQNILNGPPHITSRIYRLCAQRTEIDSRAFVGHMCALEVMAERDLDEIFDKLTQYKFAEPTKIPGCIYHCVHDQAKKCGIPHVSLPHLETVPNQEIQTAPAPAPPFYFLPPLPPLRTPPSLTSFTATKTTVPKANPYTEFLIEFLSLAVDKDGRYNEKPTPKTDLSSRAIRVAQTHGIPPSDFLQITFSGTSREKMRELLLDGVFLEGSKYMFVGYSNSGLQQQQAWLLRQTEKMSSPHQLWEKLGDFTEPSRQGAAKFGCRVAMSFAGSLQSIELQEGEYEELDDSYALDGTMQTDGCGEISLEKATKIAERLGFAIVPAAFQIRAYGYKGMLFVVGPSILPRGTVHYIFRNSMRKFSAEKTGYNHIDILSWNGYATALLSAQIIRALLARNVPQQFFEKIFDSQLAIVTKALDSRKSAKEFLNISGNTAYVEQLNHMLDAGFDPQTEPYLHQQLLTLQKLYVNKFLKKPQLRLRNTWSFLGVYDPYNELPPGTVYFERVYFERGIEHSEPFIGQVLLFRHPLYDKNSVRIVQAVDAPSLRGTRNLLVFSQHASSLTSLPNMASSGDLDGDRFVVCADSDLVGLVSDNETPFDCQSLPTAAKGDPMPMEQLVPSLVAHYCRAQEKKQLLGRLDFYMSILADLSEDGIGSKSCQQIIPILQMCLDGPKSGIFPDLPNGFDSSFQVQANTPHYLRGPRHSTSIFGYMFDKMQAALKNLDTLPTVPVRMDPHLELSPRDPEYEDFLARAKKIYGMYKHHIHKIISQVEEPATTQQISKSLKELNWLTEFSISPGRSSQIEQITEEGRRVLFSGLHWASKRKMASAIYEVVYQRAVQELNANNSTNINQDNIAIFSNNNINNNNLRWNLNNNNSTNGNNFKNGDNNFENHNVVFSNVNNLYTNNDKSGETNLRNNKDQNSSNNKFPFSFAWNVALELICAIKADALAEEAGKLAARSIAPSSSQFLRR